MHEFAGLGAPMMPAHEKEWVFIRTNNAARALAEMRRYSSK
jgi:hypothetical protein